VVVGAADRAGLQRLCRYVARPPLSASRLEVLEGGQVRVHLKRPWADGTAYISMTRLAFLERLASLVPPPRKQRVALIDWLTDALQAAAGLRVTPTLLLA
jgi:hypothetical protein